MRTWWARRGRQSQTATMRWRTRVSGRSAKRAQRTAVGGEGVHLPLSARVCLALSWRAVQGRAPAACESHAGGGVGPGEADEEDDPYKLPISHEVALEGGCGRLAGGWVRNLGGWRWKVGGKAGGCERWVGVCVQGGWVLLL